jgi:ABC-type oligopeptide transport system substrate-binding subunit
MSNDETSLPGSIADRAVLAAISRRKFVGGAAGVLASFAATGMFNRAGAAPLQRFGLANYLAQTLPDDAAAADQQTFVVPADPSIPKVLDFYEAVYERPSDGASDLFSDPLVRMDRNFQIIPAAAESWSSDETGTIWTFKIKQGLMWNDGNPLTGNDFVKTFQYGADPAHAWDFTWFFDGVMKNWHEVINGTMPVDQLGVKTGADEYEFIMETVDPAPYLPSMLLYSCPLSKAALEKYGPLYNTKPETHVSSGPFKLEEWTPDQQIVYVKNDAYTGALQVPVNKVFIKLAAPTSQFGLYQTDEIDFMGSIAPQDLQLVLADPDMATQAYSGVGDFRTYYLFFDVTKAPFDDLRVRQAFSHVIDRDAIASSVLGPQGTPAYSWLAPGFPASDRDGLKSIQNYDVATAKQLMADAGFPDGSGFPKQEMWLRAETPLNQNVAAAIAAMLTENLGIEVEVSNRDQKLFTDSLNAKPTEIPFGYVAFGMDFLDPVNMLSVWKSGGRHSWSNPDFDKGLEEAGSFLGDPAQRIEMFKAVEKILVEDVPGVFVYHYTPVQMIKPWVKGDFILPDDNGITSLHWPGYSSMDTSPSELYISSDASNRP